MSNFKVITPLATTNKVTNPSFETGTTGWATDGTNTVAQSADYQLYGTYSAKVIWNTGGSTTLLTFSNLTLTAAAYIFSAYVYIPSTWDGGAISLGIASFTSATTNTATTTTTTTGSWQRLQMKFTPDGGDLVGDIHIKTASAPSDDKFIYIDGVQCELQSTITTYCDGDQDGCTWAGAPHGSTSSRDVTSRAGGLVKDFQDDLGMYVEQMSGVGMPPMVNILASRAHLDGGEFQRSIAQPRRMKLVVTVTGDSLSDYHSDRQTILEALRPDANSGEQPVLLQYTGAGDTKEIACRYESGLETNMSGGFAETFPISLIASEPYWNQQGNSGAALDPQDSFTVRNVVMRYDGDWNEMGPPTTAASGGAVNAILYHNGVVYVGGNFTDWNGVANADYIAQYTISTATWAALGTGMNSGGIVRALAVGPDGGIYAGGDFTTAGSTLVRGIAKWNGAAWSAIGPPSDNNGAVFSIAFDRNNNLYIGGSFTDLDSGTNTDYIAYWNGSAWGAVGTGIAGSQVRGMAWDNRTGSPLLYAAGSFTTAGGNAAANIAVWNGTAWAAMGSGLNDTAYSLFYREGLVYVGGAFTTAGGNAALYAAVWNGTSFAQVGNGLSALAYTLYPAPNGEIWAGMSAADGRILKLVGNTWQKPNIDLPSTAVYAIHGDGEGNVYVGFDGVGTATAGGTVTITNNGTAKAYPVIRIKRAGGTTATIESIRNETTGAELILNYNILDGETITIDLRPGRRSVVTDFVSSSSNIGTNRAGTSGTFSGGIQRGRRIWPIQPGSDVIGFYLIPGTNLLTVYIDQTGSPTLTATIEWRETYWSID